MKQIILILFLLPAFCAAQTKYTDKELWNGVPAEKLPLDRLKLILKCEPPKAAGIPGREYIKPHGIGIGLENIGDSTIEKIDLFLIFFNETAYTHLKMPDGKTLDYKMQRGSRGQLNWTAIQPGEDTWYMVMPLWDWFPAVTNAPDGAYAFWWKVGTNTSDRLLLQKNGIEITEIRENPEHKSGPYP